MEAFFGPLREPFSDLEILHQLLTLRCLRETRVSHLELFWQATSGSRTSENFQGCLPQSSLKNLGQILTALAIWGRLERFSPCPNSSEVGHPAFPLGYFLFCPLLKRESKPVVTSLLVYHSSYFINSVVYRILVGKQHILCYYLPFHIDLDAMRAFPWVCFALALAPVISTLGAAPHTLNRKFGKRMEFQL